MFVCDFCYAVNINFLSKVLFSNLLGNKITGLKVVGFFQKVFIN